MKTLHDAILFIKANQIYCTDAVIDGMIFLACEVFDVERQEIWNLLAKEEFSK